MISQDDRTREKMNTTTRGSITIDRRNPNVEDGGRVSGPVGIVEDVMMVVSST